MYTYVCVQSRSRSILYMQYIYIYGIACTYIYTYIYMYTYAYMYAHQYVASYAKLINYICNIYIRKHARYRYGYYIYIAIKKKY